MELWNRTFVAVTIVLGLLLCGVVSLAALLAKFPNTDLPNQRAIRRPTIPAPQTLSPETRQAIALRTLELATARARNLELESQVQRSQQRVRELERQLRQIHEQFSDASLDHEASLELLTALLETTVSHDAVAAVNSAAQAESGELADPPQDEENAPIDSLERQLELENLREQVAELQLQLEQLELEFDLELAELLFRKQEFGKTTAELFAQLGEAGIPILVEALESPEPLVRQWAADSLRALGTAGQAAIPYLTLALEDTDQRVREAARAALSAVRD